MPRAWGVAGQGVLGVYIGTMVQPDVLGGLADSWLPVVVIALGTLVLSVGGGALLGLNRRVDSLTGSLALVAGGASGLVALTRELGGDERVVAVVQYVRVGLVTVSMPIVATLVFGAHTSGGSSPKAVRTSPIRGGAWCCCGRHRCRAHRREADPPARRRTARAAHRHRRRRAHRWAGPAAVPRSW